MILSQNSREYEGADLRGVQTLVDNDSSEISTGATFAPSQPNCAARPKVPYRCSLVVSG